MPKNSFHDVFQNLRILLARDGLHGTDEELLAKVNAGDEASFAALVHRHGRMVLGVCRRVLGNEHDAEDACQATFLILAQKARTISKKESLGSWLHGVAFRVSSDLRKKLKRRAAQPLETKVAGTGREASRLLEWQELFQALDAEIALLPERYRAPLVACYLDGLTRDEAATRLGWSLNCFRGRLERGREMLRRRLCTRGFTLPIAILATALAETAAPAAVPAYLIVRTVKTAWLVREGALPAALGLTELVADILSKGTTMSTKATASAVLKKLVLLTVTVGIVLGGRAVYRSYLGPSAEASWAEGQPLESINAEDKVELTGRVLDPGGRPALGAKIHIVSESPSSFGDGKPRATTGSDGMFRLSVPRVGLALHLGAGKSVSIVATSSGLGMGWSDAYSFLAKKDRADAPLPELRLVSDDVPLYGRIVTTEGMAIEGAKVTLETAWANPRGDLTSWVNAIKQNKNFGESRWHVPSELAGAHQVGISARTDRAGEFRLPGIGRDRVVLLRLSGPALGATTVLARTEAGAPLSVKDLHSFFWPQAQGCFGAEVVVSATPSRPIVGTVRDLDTGKPVAGAIVQSHCFSGSQVHGIDTMQTRTDAQGHYELDGMPIGTGNILLARTPPDVAYLPSAVPIDTNQGEGPVTCDIKVKRGIWAVGKVLDSDGRPLSANIDYYCLATNRHAGEAPGFTFAYALGALYSTQDDGRFHVPVLPGQGILAARLHGKSINISFLHLSSTLQGDRYYSFAQGDIAGVPKTRNLFYQALPMDLLPGNHHAFAALDVNASAVSVTSDLHVGTPQAKGGKP
jgi:RNA polymerase sigma factor (sigma-70 family)